MKAALIRWIAKADRYCTPWGEDKRLRALIPAGILLFCSSLGFAFLAFHSANLWLATIASLISGMVLIISLWIDSAVVFHHFFGFSKRDSLLFVRRLDPSFDRVVARSERRLSDASKEKRGAMVKPESEGIMDDYVTRRPLRRILGFLWLRTASNLLFTIITFSILTTSIITVHQHFDPACNPYGHKCRVDGASYASMLWHGFYYHSVVFQSLGDGNHSPQTILAQALATFEAFIAMSYVALLLGGSISVATFVESALTEDVIRDDLSRTLSGLCPIPTERPSGGPES